jgi:hypothetical protein
MKTLLVAKILARLLLIRALTEEGSPVTKICCFALAFVILELLSREAVALMATSSGCRQNAHPCTQTPVCVARSWLSHNQMKPYHFACFCAPVYWFCWLVLAWFASCLQCITEVGEITGLRVSDKLYSPELKATVFCRSDSFAGLSRGALHVSPRSPHTSRAPQGHASVAAVPFREAHNWCTALLFLEKPHVLGVAAPVVKLSNAMGADVVGVLLDGHGAYCSA